MQIYTSQLSDAVTTAPSLNSAYIGHPVIGDRLYGGESAARMLLHSAKITFSHPVTGKSKTIPAPVPPDFRKIWEEVKAKDN